MGKSTRFILSLGATASLFAAVPAAHAEPLFAIDFNDRTVADTTPPNTPPGFYLVHD